VDLLPTPFTNTLPIRRLRLAVGDSREILVAYVTVPGLELSAARQRYTRLEPRDGRDVYRFEGLGSGFVAEVTVDAEGLVVDYPGLFRRV
jgi:hypothetical protein